MYRLFLRHHGVSSSKFTGAANGCFCLVTRVGARISSLVGPDSMVSLVTEAGAPALVGIRVVRGVPMPTGGPGWSTAISVHVWCHSKWHNA